MVTKLDRLAKTTLLDDDPWIGACGQAGAPVWACVTDRGCRKEPLAPRNRQTSMKVPSPVVRIRLGRRSTAAGSPRRPAQGRPELTGGDHANTISGASCFDDCSPMFEVAGHHRRTEVHAGLAASDDLLIHDGGHSRTGDCPRSPGPRRCLRVPARRRHAVSLGRATGALVLSQQLPAPIVADTDLGSVDKGLSARTRQRIKPESVTTVPSGSSPIDPYQAERHTS